MKFTIQQKEFEKLVRDVSPAISNKNILPVLRGLYLEAAENKLIAKANDLEVSLTSWVEADIEEEGKIVLPDEKLRPLISQMRGEVKVSVKNNKANIRCGKSRHQISGYPAEDFPTLPDTPGVGFWVDGKNFVELVKRVKFAADKSKNPINPHNEGANMIVNNGELTLVSNDEYHFAIDKITTNRTKDLFAIIPAKALNIIQNFKREKIIISFHNNIMKVDGGIILTSRLINGSKMPYEQFLLKEIVGRAVVNRIDLLDAALRSSIQDSVISLSFRDGCVEIKTKETEEGQAVELLNAIEVKAGKGFYDIRRIISALKVMNCEKVVLGITRNGIFLKITPGNPSDFVYIVGGVRGFKEGEESDDSTRSDSDSTASD